MRWTLREPCPLPQLLPEQGHKDGEPQAILQQSEAEDRRNGGEGFSGRGHENMNHSGTVQPTCIVPI